jgi:hypothetical protein
MAMMLGALYKALTEPTEENARRAAEEVAGYESRLAAIDMKLAVGQALLGISVTLLLGLLWLVLRLSEQLAAIAAKVGVP